MEASATDPGAFTTLSTAANHPLLATAAIAEAQRFPIPAWRPRAGRDKSFEPFLEAVTLLFNAFGLNFEQLNELPPLISPEPSIL